ncbi:hypothetical protein WICMUC_002215 [Wickerhamomyces mucosus]|uniref:Importin N-terminal domain-containing protein n=1 Tax=Wickerhamomyces mucosus TaxID=1378264 RepID=A0A9P8PQ18_9ASCO|nr:hypothetical protein WICMUC_002215 [Wickerhamomyces mucosus]
MEREQIVDVLSRTLDSNPQMRKHAESQLSDFEKQPGFTAYCLDLATDKSIPLGQRISATIFFKNRILMYWNVDNEKGIKIEEQDQIKIKIIESLLKNHDDTHIRPQLSTSLRSILNRGTWPLFDPINQLLNNKADGASVYTGLILLFEVIRNLRYNQSDRTVIDTYINQTFPILETLAAELTYNSDHHSGEILYLILKIFKYATLSLLPQYLYNTEKLSTWISLHLHTAQKELPQEVLSNEPSDRPLDKRVKARKWAFANLHKLYAKYGCPTSKVTSPEFIDFFNKTFVHEILKVYFSLVEKWSQGYWLDDSSLYHLISFLEKCIMSPGWEYLEPHFDSILRHLLFPSLCQNDLELFEDDPEEYIRRYFDVNRETKTPDVATVDVLFVTVHHKFNQLPFILNLLNEIFNNYNTNDSIENALKAEGGLRVLSSISFVLGKEGSPVSNQIDQMIDGIVVPQLTSKHLFLRARSCETISILSHRFIDKNVLSRVFQGVYENFRLDDNLPIQIEAADALKVLINDPLVTDVIKNDVPTIMQKLLHLSKSFDLDMIGEVMEEFVINFSAELEPFARELGTNLAEQFIRTATEIIEIQASGKSDGSDLDKEYQAVGYTKTMTSMIVYMSNVDLEASFLPVVKFVLENAAITFLGEVMEILECLTLNKKAISPAIWEIFQETINSFETYAAEYLEYYIPFFENIVTYGFKGLNYQAPQVQLLQNLLQELISSPVNYDNQGAFEVVEYITLTIGSFNELFPLVLETFKEEDFSPFCVIKVLLASLYVDPGQTLQILESQNETIRLLEIWYNLSSSLENVYGLKLQIVALLSLLSLSELPNSLAGFIPQLSNKLIVSIERLPQAINKTLATYRTEKSQQQIAGQSLPGDDEDEYDDEYDDEDSFKDTPLSDLNIYHEFEEKFLRIQQVSSERSNQILSSLQPEKIQSIKNVMSVEGQQRLGI